MTRLKKHLAVQSRITAQTMPTPTTATHTTTQTSPLLGLPGEIKNRIFELAMPTNARVSIFPSPANGLKLNCRTKLHYLYSQPVPPILQTCRQLRADGLALYYASNTFRLMQRMFDFPRAFEGFLSARRWGLEHLQRVEISHTVTVTHIETDWVSGNTLEQGGCDWDVAFAVTATSTAESGASGIAVAVHETRQRGKRYFEYNAGERDGLCCCMLLAMAKSSPGGPGAVAGLLRDYVGMIEEYSHPKAGPAVRSVRYRAERPGAKVCLQCKKVRGI